MKNLRKIIKTLQNHEKRICELEGNNLPRLKSEIIATDDGKGSEDSNLVLSIVNKVGDCDESEKIQSKILDQKDMKAKIILCFYISYKYFKNEWLTTGDIERITSGLGTKIAVGNVSNKIKSDLRQYLESGSVRKKGIPTPYRLNRKGTKYFESLLNPDEKE